MDKKCTFEGCDRPLAYSGLCLGHVTQRNRGQELRPLTRQFRPTDRDADGNKPCTRCREWLPLDRFTRDKSQKDGLNSYCRDCHRMRVRLSKYRLTEETFRAMWDGQSGRCACCGDELNPKATHVDHDHACCPGDRTCGQCTRALLCLHCNCMLGHARDQVARLKAGVTYLEGFAE